MDFVFKKCTINTWSGRYATIPGKTSTLRVKSVNGRTCPVILWNREESIGTCCALEGPSVREMTDAILAGKRKFGGGGGGAFVINEYGQVLVPASDGSGKRALVGEIQGKLLFDNPFQDNSVLDLSDDAGLTCGDPWTLPYVGIPYNLSKRSDIYFYRQTEEGGEVERPMQQDEELIEKLRSIRRYGAMRFIVNPYGVVVTKQPKSEKWNRNEEWVPIFVGHINKKAWFNKEG